MTDEVDTLALVFPFELYGNGGTGAGATALADYLAEVLEDNALESRPTRCDSYRDRVAIREISLSAPKALQSWRTIGRHALRQAFKQKQRAIWLGGNHLSALPVYEELGSSHPSKALVVQFDAHLDIYALHDVTTSLSNGNFLLHSEESLPSIVNLGHRDLFLPKPEIGKTFAGAHSSLDIARDIDRVAKDVQRRAEKAERVWIDIDVDAFDPSHVPGVHHPLPFGLAPLQVLRLLEAAFTGNVVGIGFSEFDPGRDRDDRSLGTLGWLLEWLLLAWYE